MLGRGFFAMGRGDVVCVTFGLWHLDSMFRGAGFFCTVWDCSSLFSSGPVPAVLFMTGPTVCCKGKALCCFQQHGDGAS